ncbi:hypothetical protein pEaSNUABM11_00124 [Erwinia phage pEa_SNUABM_11]|nr:hypothetical protein pEaSNUABM11_00124 [Erwinia phage pEa_SNUABM_11]
MTITTYVKEAFSVGLSEAIEFYMINRIVEKHAQVFRNDCRQGAWMNLPREMWPDLLSRTDQFNVRPNYEAIYKLQLIFGKDVLITTWECSESAYEVKNNPNSMVTPCIVLEAGYLTEANRRFGRQCGTSIYIPFYVR